MTQAAVSGRCEAVLRHALAARGVPGVTIGVTKRPKEDGVGKRKAKRGVQAPANRPGEVRQEGAKKRRRSDPPQPLLEGVAAEVRLSSCLSVELPWAGSMMMTCTA